MTSKLSVNNAYFCGNFVIITQLSFVRQEYSAFLHIFLLFSKDLSEEVLRMHPLS